MRMTRIVMAFVTAGATVWNIHAGAAPVYAFTVIAGEPSAGSADGTNGMGRFFHPAGLAVDAYGSVFVADSGNDTIRQLTPTGTDWVVRTIAGRAQSPGSADGTNTTARFNHPNGVAVDSAGNVFVADEGNHTIRKLTRVGTDWVSSTIAGVAGQFGNAEGTNNDARFCLPNALAEGPTGELFIVDSGNYTIRRLTPCGTNWVSSTVAGRYRSPQACSNCDGTNTDARFGQMSSIAVDSTGALYVGDSVVEYGWLDTLMRKVTRIGTNWVTSTYDQGDKLWLGIGASPDGNLYIACGEGEIIRLIPAGTNWSSSIMAGGYYAAGATDGINRNCQFYGPSAVAADTAGNLYISDTGNNAIRMLTPIGTNWVSSTLAGTPPSSSSVDGTNNAARFFHPRAITLGNNNEIYVADTDANTIREIDHVNSSWVTRTIAGAPGLSGSSDGTNSAALFSNPWGLAVGDRGVLYVADTGNDTIRKVQRNGSDWVSSTIAGLAGDYFRQDGTNNGAHFYAPNAVAVGTPTNLFVAEYEAIRELTLLGTNWVATTLAVQAAPISGIYPSGLVIGQAGALFVADEIATIDELAPAGNQWSFSAIAGLAGDYETIDGTNNDTRFVRPNAICADTNGNFYVADQAVRKFVQSGTDWVVSTIGELPSLSGDLAWGPAANNAEYDGSFAISADSSGRLYVADTYNNVIRLGLPVPIITSISRSGSGTALSWASAPGLTYQVQFNDDPSAQTWSNLGSSLTATGETTTFTDPLTAGEQRFYRVALLP